MPNFFIEMPLPARLISSCAALPDLRVDDAAAGIHRTPMPLTKASASAALTPLGSNTGIKTIVWACVLGVQQSLPHGRFTTAPNRLHGDSVSRKVSPNSRTMSAAAWATVRPSWGEGSAMPYHPDCLSEQGESGAARGKVACHHSRYGLIVTQSAGRRGERK